MNGRLPYFLVFVFLISPVENGEVRLLSIGVNPLHSSGSRRLNPRDSSPAALLSVCARLRMGDSVMDGSRQIHSSNELMNKYLQSVCADARGREIDICYMLRMRGCEYEYACGMYASVHVRLE